MLPVNWIYAGVFSKTAVIFLMLRYFDMLRTIRYNVSPQGGINIKGECPNQACLY